MERDILADRYTAFRLHLSTIAYSWTKFGQRLQQEGGDEAAAAAEDRSVPFVIPDSMFAGIVTAVEIALLKNRCVVRIRLAPPPQHQQQQQQQQPGGGKDVFALAKTSASSIVAEFTDVAKAIDLLDAAYEYASTASKE